MYAYYRKAEAYYIPLLMHILCLFTSVYITQNSKLYKHVICWQFIKNVWNANENGGEMEEVMIVILKVIKKNINYDDDDHKIYSV
jgi:hypothetical protein